MNIMRPMSLLATLALGLCILGCDSATPPAPTPAPTPAASQAPPPAKTVAKNSGGKTQVSEEDGGHNARRKAKQK